LKRIVCRCEDVTLEELERAIELGHRDIESLKRYTGFGTGFCQGKSCLVRCAHELVERGGDAARGITPRPPYHPVALAELAGIDPDWDGL
jgi:bacterioferritin-associated ferredoxin